MELMRFRPPGVAVFQAFLDSCTTATLAPYPASALSDPIYSELASAEVVLEKRAFASRFELAEYINARFEEAEFRPARPDNGLWAWIACYYFDAVCPKSGSGLPLPGSASRWIPQSADWRRYYRHLVAGPYSIYRAHRDNPKRAMALLCQKPGRPGDLVEQLASRQQIVTNPAVIQVATNLFVDARSGTQRRAANSKGTGGARRFVAVLNQFDVTWDLSMLSVENLLAIMRPEFGQ